MMNKIIAMVRAAVKKRPIVSSVYRHVRDELEVNSKVYTTQWGFQLCGNKEMADGHFEPQETDLVRRQLESADTLINIGANIGYYCCHALSMGKRVIAFEPVQRNNRLLFKNMQMNGYANIEVFPMAASDRTGIVEIYGGDTGASLIKGWAGIEESYVSLCPSTTLDNVIGDRLTGHKALVVVDVEGAELSVLKGGSRLLGNNPKPTWLVEITTDQNQPLGVSTNPDFFDTFRIMFDSGYDAFAVGDTLSPISRDQVLAAHNGEAESITAYNFLFQPR